VSELAIEPVSGAAIEPYLGALAALRIEVFAEYPYLYDGSLEYESRYLRHYASSARGLVVIAREGERVVGASTALPLLEHDEELAPPLAAAGYEPARVYYFGESVLRRDYRGRGVGHAFFDAREARARELGFATTAFCAVVRADGDPRKPADYVPHDAFWSKRGYTRHPEIVAHFAWRDRGEPAETSKPMLFWLKELQP
jgi:GNAT superfamily N-acetyltransferase